MENYQDYAEYDPVTGVIQTWGRGKPPDQPRRWVLNQISGDLRNYRVNLQTLKIEPKTSITLQINKTQAQADGLDEIQITGIPDHTTITLITPDSLRQNFQNSDSELEITSDMPGTCVIRFWHGLYVIPSINLEFI